MGLTNIDLNNININGDNFDEDDLKFIVHVRLMASRKKYKSGKSCEKTKINKELMPVAWNPIRW